VNQANFNKLITLSLFLFFMAMYVLSWLTGKELDWIGLLAFVVPTLNHAVHQVVEYNGTAKKLNSDTAIELARNGKNGVT